MDSYEEAVLLTIGALESRLDRLEYCLSGRPRQSEEKPRSLQERLQRIERLLQELSAKTELLHQVQELITRHSDIIPKQSIRNLHSQESDPKEASEPNLSTLEKAAIVAERAPTFATVASQLKALDDQQIPPVDGFNKLVKLRPRIAEAENRQLEQALKISELRKRGGLLVSRVNTIHMAGQGRCWNEWSKRYGKAEQTVRRIEFKLKQEEEG